MSDATSLLFDLPGFRVVSCALSPLGIRRVVVMQAATEHPCPRCGVLVEGKPYDRRESRIKDLPFGQRPLEVLWRKRRYRCPEPACLQQVFPERSEQVPPRCRLTGWLRAKLQRYIVLLAEEQVIPGGSDAKRRSVNGARRARACEASA